MFLHGQKLLRFDSIFQLPAMKHGSFEFGVILSQVRMYELVGSTAPVGVFSFTKRHREVLPVPLFPQDIDRRGKRGL